MYIFVKLVENIAQYTVFILSLIKIFMTTLSYALISVYDHDHFNYYID